MCGFGHSRREVQEHRVARLHVGGPAPVHQVALAMRRHVVGDRHRVEVTGHHHPTAEAAIRAGQDGVAAANHLEPGRLFAQRLLDGVGNDRFVLRHTGISTRAAVRSIGSECRSRCGAAIAAQYGIIVFHRFGIGFSQGLHRSMGASRTLLDRECTRSISSRYREHRGGRHRPRHLVPGPHAGRIHRNRDDAARGERHPVRPRAPRRYR